MREDVDIVDEEDVDAILLQPLQASSCERITPS